MMGCQYSGVLLPKKITISFISFLCFFIKLISRISKYTKMKKKSFNIKVQKMVYPRIEKLRDRIIWGVQYFLCVMRVRGIICHVKLFLKTSKTRWVMRQWNWNFVNFAANYDKKNANFRK